MAQLINTITTRPTLSAGRTIGRTRSAATRSTTRSSAVSSARSRSGSSTGRGCAGSGGRGRALGVSGFVEVTCETGPDGLAGIGLIVGISRRRIDLEASRFAIRIESQVDPGKSQSKALCEGDALLGKVVSQLRRPKNGAPARSSGVAIVGRVADDLGRVHVLVDDMNPYIGP